MARYCFYCGRELGENEKCHCRERSFASNASYTDSTSQQSSESNEHAAPSPDRSQTSQKTQSASHASGQGESARRPSWSERRAESRAQKEARRQAKARQSQWQSRSGYGAPPNRQNTEQQRRAARINIFTGFIRFFATPALHMTQCLSTAWTVSHTVWLAVAVVLSGAHYFSLNRFLSVAGTKPFAEVPFQLRRAFMVDGHRRCRRRHSPSLTMWLIARFFKAVRTPFHAHIGGRQSSVAVPDAFLRTFTSHIFPRFSSALCLPLWVLFSAP